MIYKTIVHWKLGRTEFESKDYYEGFIGTGPSLKSARDYAEREIKLKRDQFESQRINFISLETISLKEAATKLPAKIKQRISDDWQIKLTLSK